MPKPRETKIPKAHLINSLRTNQHNMAHEFTAATSQYQVFDHMPNPWETKIPKAHQINTNIYSMMKLITHDV